MFSGWGRIAVVSFEWHGHEWLHVTDGRSTHEVVRNAMRFFADPFWKGPRPRPDEIFTVSIVADPSTWRVSGRAVNEEKPNTFYR